MRDSFESQNDFVYNPNLENVYASLEDSRKKYGKLYKFEIHLHTPASEDYEIEQIKDNNEKKYYYKDRTVEWILEYACSIGMINPEEYRTYLDNYLKGAYGIDYINQLKSKGLYFIDFKEYFTYHMIAYKLYAEEIEGVIIADHNTIAGYKKLKSMINYCYQNAFHHIDKKDIWIILGIEISCSDGNHVVAMFDEKQMKDVEKFIDEYIVSNGDSKLSGSIEHSLSVINKVTEIGGKAYIAHINTAKFKNLTGMYKNQLFNSPNFDLFGVTNTTFQIENVIRSFSPKKQHDFCIFYESDSHGINTIGIKNTWIKMNKINFKNLMKAAFNHSISVYPYEKPKLNPVFIKGVYIPEGHSGFFKNNSGPFYFNFSKDLTCIIGGRGTGKSTILNILDIIFSQESVDKKVLSFVSKHQTIYVTFRINREEYIIRFTAQINSDFEEDSPYFFLDQAFKSKRNIDSEIYLNDHWTNLYQVQTDQEKNHYLFREIKGLADKSSILNKLNKKHYSISKIINLIEKNDFAAFIRNLMFSGQTLDTISEKTNLLMYSNKRDFLQIVGKEIMDIQSIIDTWKTRVNDTLNKFNLENKDILRIKLHNSFNKQEYYLTPIFDRLLNNISYSNNNSYRKQFVASTTLKWSDVVEYIEAQVSKMGVLSFLRALYNREHDFLESNFKLLDFVTTTQSTKTIDYNLKDARELKTPGKLFTAIREELANHRMDLAEIISDAYLDSDNFMMEFNVNAKEEVGSPTRVNMKNINELSLGQKVVAILTFIINYGRYTNDQTPLIIDQPEDNLDNQYIYKTLVKSLQKIKNERQVIIVTHNSTLVTNAGAEQVVVLESNDGFNSQLKAQGYSNDKQIMEHIVNYLEGGPEAFSRKMKDYKTILGEKIY